MKFLTRSVIILSFVSLFTDMASEMLYPIMPVYLQSIGFTALFIGILEGLAEFISGTSKGYFGSLSDVSGKKVLFIRIGYGLSALSKPLLAIFQFPIWIFLARTMDRFGKGIRTAPRDALLSSETTTANKGKVFGFHRGMDTLGAVIGPSLALLYLYFYPANYKTLFLIAFFPGMAAVLFTFLIREKAGTTQSYKKNIKLFSFLNYWKTSPAEYRKISYGILLFTLFNSSDMFLLLQVKHNGGTDTQVIALYIFYNLVYAVASLPAGYLGDKLGLKKAFCFGLLVFSLVYAGFGYASEIKIFYALFLLYGIYAALNEGIAKAWISNIVPPTETATAVGTLAGLQSVATMAASAMAGLIWVQFGSTYLFIISGIFAMISAIYLFSVSLKRNSL